MSEGLKKMKQTYLCQSAVHGGELGAMARVLSVIVVVVTNRRKG